MRDTTVTRARIKRFRNRGMVFASFGIRDLAELVDERDELHAQLLLRDVSDLPIKDAEVEQLRKELEQEREQMFHAATVLSIASGLLAQWVKDSGDCDHSAGICCCPEKQVILEANKIYDQNMLAYTRRLAGERHEG